MDYILKSLISQATDKYGCNKESFDAICKLIEQYKGKAAKNFFISLVFVENERFKISANHEQVWQHINDCSNDSFKQAHLN